MDMNESWQTCIQHYEAQKQREMWQEHAEAMIRLIERMRSDKSLNNTRRLISHQWLRIGPNINDPAYKPGVWIGSRKPNYYWFGVGSFGTKNRVTVTADRAIPMLKRYLENLIYLDPEFKQFAPADMVETLQDDDGVETIDFGPSELCIDLWSSDYLSQKFDTVPLADLVPVLAEDLIEQNNELRDFTGKLQSIMDSIREIESAEQTIEEMMQRIERISAIIDAGLARYRHLENQNQEGSEPDAGSVNEYQAVDVVPPDTVPFVPVRRAAAVEDVLADSAGMDSEETVSADSMHDVPETTTNNPPPLHDIDRNPNGKH